MEADSQECLCRRRGQTARGMERRQPEVSVPSPWKTAQMPGSPWKRPSDARRRVGQSSPWLGQGENRCKENAAAKAAAASVPRHLVATSFAAANPLSDRFPRAERGARLSRAPSRTRPRRRARGLVTAHEASSPRARLCHRARDLLATRETSLGFAVPNG